MTKKQKDSTTHKKNGDQKPSSGKKKKNRRQKIQNPNLKPQYNLKTRTDLLDQDYLHKLNPEELAWLDKFNKEEVSASYEKDNKLNLGKTKRERKASYDRNNARNRCILTRQKAAGRLKQLDEIIETPKDPVEMMELMIDLKMVGLVDEDGTPKKK